MNPPTITRFDAVPVRGMPESAFDAAALSFFPKLVPFSDDMNAAVEWMAQAFEAITDAQKSASGSAGGAAESALAAARSAQEANNAAARAEGAVSALPIGSINDAMVAPDTAWSSQKANAEITQKRNKSDTSFSRYDVSSMSTISTLDLVQQQVFRVLVDQNHTLLFVNPPPDGRAMTVVVRLEGDSGAVEWPASILWAFGSPPVLRATWTVVTLFFDGQAWYGFVSGGEG